MTGFRNPALAKIGTERGFRKAWLRNTIFHQDGIKKVVWLLAGECDQVLVRMIYGDDAVDDTPKWMRFSAKLLKVAAKMNYPAFALLPI